MLYILRLEATFVCCQSVFFKSYNMWLVSLRLITTVLKRQMVSSYVSICVRPTSQKKYFAQKRISKQSEVWKWWAKLAYLQKMSMYIVSSKYCQFDVTLKKVVWVKTWTRERETKILFWTNLNQQKKSFECIYVMSRIVNSNQVKNFWMAS